MLPLLTGEKSITKLLHRYVRLLLEENDALASSARIGFPKNRMY